MPRFRRALLPREPLLAHNRSMFGPLQRRTFCLELWSLRWRRSAFAHEGKDDEDAMRFPPKLNLMFTEKLAYV